MREQGGGAERSVDGEHDFMVKSRNDNRNDKAVTAQMNL